MGVIVARREGADAAIVEVRQPFSLWLLSQANRGDSLSEPAKAAKLDRLFPRAGSADDVRARFSLAGADGDAFEALEDAEREYERSSLRLRGSIQDVVRSQSRGPIAARRMDAEKTNDL